ncbi:chromodomain-helicase-DNA-binding protein 6 isoform X1 [Dromiciops gliroides]|uniref:chromodomain-helicase-DNA-binding protein 6 isoform X1 n=1 Tax=Dromiciops gliroides TaxID=33562 RepID=UPI001CC4FEEF|nr:chromodomain-helicase-DNA-binding protein 6 isoform X1 [Dromiciops gliroides]XP_043843003.1 chromodomain-helicase-DNA-binding protein 6 isoform X1 [Dromiciops gliroides]XP_043843004.1 chromodomain-helicase-DNA-binding protein 6 isoform X1 [Dromiciops gliroides]XP_043843005.1 chromodomain-helicase-DNA-binding protein 6 isoform X1 [Dromiciops gliroides]
MIMKIQKKEKQQFSNLKVLSRSPMSDASVTCEYKSQSSFVSSTDKEEKITDLASHCILEKDLYPAEDADHLFPRKMTSHNGMEDSGGGGTGVKKKRKKKDPSEQEAVEKGVKDKEPKPKRKREPKEPKEPKKVKEPKKQKEPKQKETVKKSRKPREPKLSKDPKDKRGSTDSTPKMKSKKASKEQGPTPVEKRKKGKRKNDLSVENLELDQGLLSPSHRNPEESAESADSQKRRSGRQVKRRKYNEDLDFKVVDDDGETIAVLGAGRTSALSASTLAWQAEEPPEDDANIIEKILASKMVPKEVHPGELPFDMELFYVKYRNFSYLHCKWATMEELEKDPRISQKIKRFRNKQAQMKHIFTEPDEDLFNPDYVEVDRILEVAHTKDSDTGEEVTHYLVKWCSLPYEESTWELEEDVDPAKVKEFESLQILPEIKHVERPASDSWQKLEKSREYKNNNQLREYQLEGMNWLLFNWYNRKNCILADEMGLGKTIQSITFLSEIFLMGIHGPFLIIAPLSTITNWEREFRTWTEMNAIVYHGSQISRQMIQQYEMLYRDAQGNPLSGVFKFHVVITTFEMILADCPELKKIHWSCVIIDEAHRLKNRNCKLLEGLKLMALEHKVLLTGTPLQNSVEELFSLLNFLEPSQFPSETAFLEEFGDLKTEEQVKKLQSILKPMMLRRLKDDVEKNLAPKQETIIEVELTNIQKKYYRAILEKNFSFLAKGANQHNMPNLINTMMELRKCCNHPYLINGAEEKILEDFRKTHSPDSLDFQLQAMIQAAGKLVLIDKLLPKLIAGGHKVLIFSQMVRCLDILEDYLIQRRYTYERIDGRVRGNLRQAAIDRFCKPDSDRFVFLLCTRAGGLGINLTAADTCIIFDSDWNPQNDLQAQARCHRIGQSKAVKVYRLITRNSYEREMFDKASLKLGLDKAVLQDINRKGSTNGVQQLTKIEVEDLLRKGAYGALMDEEDEGSKFCEEDIDQILQRRTHTITIQSEGKGSTFAKASFVASGNRTDISLDDPNFWQKWAKIAELDTDAKNEKESLVIDRPRVRKQTKHYNSFEEDELMEFSELDSDSDERPTRSRRLNEKTRRYLRAECFRVEKNLLIFGWGRWKDILTHGRFKWHLNEKDMEMICRALLVYCVKHYKGDEKIKSFIWDLITPTKDGQNQALQNHSGLSAPVPRGRKGKKTKNQILLPELKNADWLATCNPEVVLHDDSYKKHLKQHCNKVLLRVRMLYYLKSEVLGEAADKAFEGTPARELDVLLPDIDYVEIPVDWWDAEADKSLLIGVVKHGYERYNAMRADPALCFLEKVGMPDEKSLSAEQGVTDGSQDISERSNLDKEDNTEDKLDGLQKQLEDTSFGESEKKDETMAAQDGSDPDRSPWPVSSALTARLRRLVTVYQRCNRKEPTRAEILGPGNQGYWVQEDMFRRATEIDPINKEIQKRWTRREQADFYRTVSSFGVVYDQEKKSFDWTQFRVISRLDKKTDESLEKYFYSFVAMCRNVCRLPMWKDDGPPDPTLYVEPITEERAARTLYRIELLRKVREQVLKYPQLHERLQLCRPSLYLPVWWECGKHDRDLLIGTAKHGLSRTDYYIMNDPQLSFLDAYRNYAQHRRAEPQGPDSACCLYQTNSRLYESLTYTQMGRTCESIDTEPENQLKMESMGDNLSHTESSLPDVTCENFISKVQDIISINHDESLLPDSLECMMFGEKVFNSEPSSFIQENLSSTESKKDVSVALAGKNKENQPGSLEVEVATNRCSLGNLEAKIEQMSNKNEKHLSLLAIKDMDSNKYTPVPRHETIRHPEAKCSIPQPLEQGNVSRFMEMCSLSVCNSERKLSSEQQLIDLLGNKSLEDKLLLSQNHSDEEEEEEEDEEEENSEVGAQIRKRPEGIGQIDLNTNISNEMGRCFTIDKTKERGPETQNRDPTELRSVDQTVCQCHCKPIDRWKNQGDSVEFEMEKTKFHDPDLFKGKAVNSIAIESGNKTLLSEPLKVNHEFLKEDSWEDKAERQRSYSTCPLDRSDLKQDVDFENKEDDDDKDGNLQGQDYPGKYSEEESKSSASGIAGDIGDELQEVRAPTIAQLLQEKTLYSFSEWPKDRVIINRIDNICHAVLKGKWPSSQQYEMPSTLPAPVLISSPSSRNSIAEQETPGPNFSNGAALVTQIPKESFLAPIFAKDERKHRRPYEFDMERDLKSRSLEQFSASHGHPPIMLNGWRGESAIDLSCTPDAPPATTSPFPLSTSTPKIGTVSTLQGSLGMDLSGILQAGLIHPVTGQIVNGTLRRDDAAMRRRRGRRKNVEGGMDLIFLKDRTLQTGILEVQEDQEQPSPSSTLPDGPISATSSPHTVTTTSVPAEKTIPNKSLLDWLRQQSDYTIEVPTFGTNFSDKPKQRRQRCKEPGKLDMGSLSGEERVPAVHKETGRQGFLPENKFSQILTEPVLRDAGPRRRGRRPRSDLIKAPGIVADSPSGMGPLFMNGLIAGMDLVGLQNMRNMQGIPLTGLVGFPAGFAAVPAGEDVKSTLSMLPMMLPGMAAVPQMFGVGGLLNTPMTTTCTSTVPSSLTSTTKSGTSNTEKATDDKQNSHDVKKDTLAEDKPIPNSFSDQSEPAITTSSPVAFNPFLLPGMSPGLIYPSMFLSPGIGMTLPGMQQTRHSENTSLESQKRKRKKAKGDTLNPDPETVPVSEKESGNGQNCSEHTPLLPTDKEHGVQAEQSDLKGTHSDTN